MVASNRTGVSTLSQSCVSCGDAWKYNASLPVSGFHAKIDAVYRLAQGRPCPANNALAVPALPRKPRIGVAGSPIQKVELGIVRARQPRHAAAVIHRGLIRPRVGPRVAHLLRLAPPLPLQFARLGIARFEISAHIHGIA